MFNPIINGIVDPSKIDIACYNCGGLFKVSQGIQAREIITCPYCDLAMMAVEEKIGRVTIIDFISVQH